LPGMGKTTLAQCLATVLGLQYRRIQFTSDLLPSDILGVSVFNKNDHSFEFHPGPIFSQLLLADEINRTTPKTQSALLEAMEENQVSIEGETRPLPDPFFVIATQNPLHQSGTFPLPESQLDRFLLRISLGYPSPESEKLLYQGVNPRQRLSKIEPVINRDQLHAMQEKVDQVVASDALLGYLQRLVQFSRNDSRFPIGISPRGALAWLNSARAWAFIHNREYLVPEDLQTLLEPVVGHRLNGGRDAEELSVYLLNSVDVMG